MVMIIESRAYKVFKVFNSIFLTLILIATLFPMLNILAKSFSSATSINSGKVWLFPVDFNINTYKIVFRDNMFWNGYKYTIIYTLIGTAVSLIMTIFCAYPLSKKYLPGKNVFIMMILITMLISGGLIPNFLLIKSLGLYNSIWAVIIPGSIATFNMFVMKTFFETTIPSELEESAMIDGLNHFGILAKIILPLSKPIISTISLFYAVAKWNEWFSAFLYISDRKKHPVTIYLREIVDGIDLRILSGDIGDIESLLQYQATLKSVVIVVVLLPILCVYPFIQKYFVKGMLIGSIKG